MVEQRNEITERANRRFLKRLVSPSICHFSCGLSRRRSRGENSRSFWQASWMC
ncbi:hypothetical protein OROHE_003250 [Orobanche hederae]